MIIAGLVGVGFAVLLVAPSIHRRINANSRAQAEQRRQGRAAALRESEHGNEVVFGRPADAARLRDACLLRGVRVELIPQDSAAVVVFAEQDRVVVETAIAELGIG